jgi:inner membrane protein
MPTPIGHSLAGYAVLVFFKKSSLQKNLYWIILVLFMANAADLDWLPGFMQGQPALFHQGLTHSLGFAILFSSGVAVLFLVKGKPFLPIFSLCFFSYITHLGLDYLSPDGREPFGIPLFWPFSNEHFISPTPIFIGVRHVNSTSASTLEWIDGILDIHNLFSITLEAIIISPFILLGMWIRRNRKHEVGKSRFQLKDKT